MDWCGFRSLLVLLASVLWRCSLFWLLFLLPVAHQCLLLGFVVALRRVLALLCPAPFAVVRLLPGASLWSGGLQ
jgi:hypothetical protein